MYEASGVPIPPLYRHKGGDTAIDDGCTVWGAEQAMTLSEQTGRVPLTRTRTIPTFSRHSRRDSDT